jgi:hypothetical protein
MVLIPAGDFTVHFSGAPVTWHLPAFLMDEREVSRRQFERFLAAAPKGPYTTGEFSKGDLDGPAVGVTEDGARAYARWAGAELPSLAHFEKAAWDSTRAPISCRDAGRKFGLRDLFGGVAEMCLDEYRTAGTGLVVMGGSGRDHEVEPGVPSHSRDDIGTAGVGFRCVIEPPLAATTRIEWRRDMWAALEEGQRRNCLVFATFHWDGCGACDRFRDRILTDPKIVEHLNERAVPVLAHSTQDFCEGHFPLPNGDCWVYAGMTCAQHRDLFERGPGRLMDFGGSPGHYFLRCPESDIPEKKDFIILDDRALRRKGTAEDWLRTFLDAQGKLGPSLTRAEYLAQQKEFEGLNRDFEAGRPDEPRIRAVASDSRAAFREEAAALLAEMARPGEWRPADVGRIEVDLRRGEFASALAALRDVVKTPHVIRVRAMIRDIDRIAWDRLMEARAYAGPHNDPESARTLYREIIEKFPRTAAQRAARKELEGLP